MRLVAPTEKRVIKHLLWLLVQLLCLKGGLFNLPLRLNYPGFGELRSIDGLQLKIILHFNSHSHNESKKTRSILKDHTVVAVTVLVLSVCLDFSHHTVLLEKIDSVPLVNHGIRFDSEIIV